MVANISIEERQFKYIEPEGFLFPSVPRITYKEWNNALDWGWLGGGMWEGDKDKIFYYPEFTLYQDMEISGNWEIEGYGAGYDYTEIIDICLHYKTCKHKKCSRHMAFGPYKNPTLARDNALKFLVEHQLVEIIEEVAS